MKMQNIGIAVLLIWPGEGCVCLGNYTIQIHVWGIYPRLLQYLKLSVPYGIGHQADLETTMKFFIKFESCQVL